MPEDGLVHRTVYSQVPPMVEYSLTKMAEDLIPILEAMDKWGKYFVDNYNHPNHKS
ncbi:winged helix-turn-helix transcriptional regulator [Clostridium lacusfryxellense]|uniref:winged helix-turn-helix transcriptional regulator n=1 Tax=Clostridium lacusfryxellense TaxID=205328 RepID=UPI001FE3A6EA|nr:helix-turn-helix domain-containing protein [Clostridium lacusfryxellense]